MSKSITAENLAEENITGENLTEENITGENITGENITGENITGENITGENITGENSASMIRDVITQTPWYDEGGSVRFLYMTFPPFAGANEIASLHQQGFEQLLTFCIGTVGTWALSEKGNDKMGEYIVSTHFADPTFLPRTISFHNEREAALESVSTDFDGVSDDELRNRFKDCCELFVDAWKPFIIIDGLDFIWQAKFDEILKENPCDLTQEEIKTLLMPNEMSYVQAEEVSLLSLRVKEMMDEDVTSDLLEHQKNFYFYDTNYCSIEERDVDHFRKRLEGPSDPQEELDLILSRRKRVQEEKTRILNSRNIPPKVKQFIDLMVTLSEQRDARKRMNCKGNIKIKKFIVEIAKRRGIDYSLLEQIPCSTAFDDAFTLSEDELLQRKDMCCGLFDLERGTIFCYGDDALSLKQIYDDSLPTSSTVEGMCASSGKVIGRARIILGKDEFSKMEEGDILVSYMTRPEFLPVMKKAAAIVTNEGGITCHAAIVSRELGVPCIIGTKNATKLLEDGMMVEVDADNGTVKVVE